ncbi:MAG: carboxypeptidase regulatory-like domain-containing protein [Thermoanaerobaculia bacterium]
MALIALSAAGLALGNPDPPPARGASLTIPFLSPNERAEEALVVTIASLRDGSEGRPEKPIAEKKISLLPAPKRSRVSFDGLEAGRWLLSWRGPGIAEEEKAFTVGKTPVVAAEIVLKAGRTLRGSVRDDLGMVVDGASIRVGPRREFFVDSPLPEVMALSGSDGTFALAGLPVDGTLSWSASAKGHVSTKGRLGGETRLEIVLSRAHRVTGRVVDADGTPIAEAGINPTYYEPGPDGRARSHHSHPGRLRTDELGRFAFDRPYLFPGRVFVRATSYLTRVVSLEAVVPDGPRELDLGDLALEKGRTVTGRVRTASDGRAVPGATVEATWTTGAGASRAGDGTQSETDAEGAFELTGLPREGAVRVAASAPSFARSSASLGADADSLDFLLGKGGRIEGELCGTAAELARSTIAYGAGGEFASRRNSLPIGPDGRFVVENAETGRWHLLRSWTFRDASGAFRSGSFGVSSAEARVVVEEGVTARVRLACDGPLVTGTLKANGAALGDRVLTLTIANRSFAAGFVEAGTGAFAIRVPTPGRWSSWEPSPPRGMAFAAPSCDVPPEGLAGCALDVTPVPASE